MTTQKLYTGLILLIFALTLFGGTPGMAKTTFSLEIGEKVQYKVEILKNGTDVAVIDWQNSGLELTEGTKFELELYDVNNPLSLDDPYGGLTAKFRIWVGEEKSEPYSAAYQLMYNNATYWEEQFENSTEWEIFGVKYKASLTEGLVTISYTANADNSMVIKFDAASGLVEEMEQKTSDSANYTHMKVVRSSDDLIGNLEEIPGFELHLLLLSLGMVSVVALFTSKRRNR